jgi:hypothetical protein
MKSASVAATVALILASLTPSAALGGVVGRALAETAEARIGRGLVTRAGAPPAVRRAIMRPSGQPCAAIPVKCAGLRREAAAQRILAERYPSERIQSEAYLLNRNGRRAVDPKTRTGRRIDFVLFNDGNVARRLEVTSQTADKTAQLAKESRILTLRRNGVRRTGPLLFEIASPAGWPQCPVRRVRSFDSSSRPRVR